MPIPDSWVKNLFAKLTVTYGQAFMRQYDGLDIEAVRANWALELDGTSAGSIGYALANLPADRPPTVLQFRDACRRAPTPPAQRLTHKPGPVSADVLQRARSITAPRRDPRAWMAELQARDEAGERLTFTQRQFLRSASQRVSGGKDGADA